MSLSYTNTVAILAASQTSGCQSVERTVVAAHCFRVGE